MADKGGWLISKRENLGPRMLTPYDVTDRFYAKGETPQEAPSIHCFHVEINRPTGKTLGGMFHIVEGTGKYDTQHIQIGVAGQSRSVPYTAAGIKTVLRRVRKQEAQAIEDAEVEIVRLIQALADARLDLKAAQATAFRAGNVVTKAEVEAVLGAVNQTHGEG